MGKVKKRNVAGNARNFITRTQAVKKLQVSLADFRRLCIFKGIYPRQPRNKKKANKGSTAPVTFYYAKDIQYLMHEPILMQFREHKAFSKKLQKALGRGEVGDAKRLDSNRPKYSLDHLVKERYPTFTDALRDLNDPLDTLFTFANLPATDKISLEFTKKAEKVCNQWLAIVSREKMIRKTFVSIKGVYYEASIKGETVRWKIPLKFPQNIPDDIDFKIMQTFLEFYITFVPYVLNRLYREANLVYPPKMDMTKFRSIGGFSSYVLNSREIGLALPGTESQDSAPVDNNAQAIELSAEVYAKAAKADADNVEDVEEEAITLDNTELDTFTDNSKNKGDILEQPIHSVNPVTVLFDNFVFFVGREVPIDVVEFLIVACGGRVISEAALDELVLNDPKALKELDLSKVTHQISDRPTIAKMVQGRTYIQPQWIFDCVNKGELLNVSLYSPGETLPAHSSPWYTVGEYDPTAPLEEGDEEEDEEEEETVEGEAEEVEEEAEEDEDEDLKAQKELEMEAAGVKFSEIKTSEEKKNNKRKAEKEAKEAKEEKDLKMVMMSNKQRKLYKKMQYGIEKKEARTEELKQKRRKIEKTKAKLDKLDSK